MNIARRIMKEIIQSVKGTRDFYPEEMFFRLWLYEKMGRVSRLFGYQEYEAPFLEYMELYAAKSGEELVKEQSFVFQDRSGDWITLRPELTPSLARMIAQKQRELVYPLRWWSFGPMWRYERPQKGRTREFFQWNIDLIGQDLALADAELVAVAASFFKEVGLKSSQIKISVNNRRLLDRQLDQIGLPKEGRSEFLKLIDRREKMKQKEWEAFARENLGLSQEEVRGILDMLSNEDLWKESEELINFFDAVAYSGLQEYIDYSPAIVRGLDYYTGTVFEAHDIQNEFRAILGGGHYDNLVEDVGGDKLPGVGFAMGDVVIALVLRKFGQLPDFESRTRSTVVVTVFDESTLAASLQIAAEIRAAGIACICTNAADRLGKQFKFADRVYARVAIVLGPDEIAAGEVAIKDLKTGDQASHPRGKLIPALQILLARDLGSW
jgi:histidyl-tRNA synthetase